MPGFDFWKWKTDVEVTLLAQGLLGNGGGSSGVPVPGPPGAPGPAGPAGPPGASVRYARHVWVSPAGGVDDGAPERGTFGAPFKTLQLACDFIGPPVNAGDFNVPWVIHVLHAGSVDKGSAGVTLPSTRRLTIHAPGCELPPLAMVSDPAQRFGSTLPAELHIHGDHGDAWFSPLVGGTSPGVCRVGDGTNAIALKVDGATASVFVLGLENVDASGLIVSPGPHNASSPLCFFRNSSFSGQGIWGDKGPAGPGTGIILQAERCAFAALPYQVRVQVVAGMTDCVVAGAFNVQAGPDPSLRRGINGCNFYSSASWSGPPQSMVLDAATNFFVKSNGAGVPAAAKTLLFDGTP